MARLRDTQVVMAHGAGGRAMRELVEDVFLSRFGGQAGHSLEDQARLALEELGEPGARLAFTTDSYVVDPLFFPGGDIGKLAVCGTVNDLAVGGARPVALSCAAIIEEGFALEPLRAIADSMATAAAVAGVRIVTGDTKVVSRGAADKLFLNTAGIGVIPPGREVGASRLEAGDKIIVNSSIGDHGAAIMAARQDLGLSTDLASDCRPLNHLADALFGSALRVRAMRDATRGGLAAVLNEFALASGVCCVLEEALLPVRKEVRGVAEILGLDPLYLANEGLFCCVVHPDDSEMAVEALRGHGGGEQACVIGEVRAAPAARLILKSGFGGERLVDLLEGDQLPRIC